MQFQDRAGCTLVLAPRSTDDQHGMESLGRMCGTDTANVSRACRFLPEHKLAILIDDKESEICSVRGLRRNFHSVTDLLEKANKCFNPSRGHHLPDLEAQR